MRSKNNVYVVLPILLVVALGCGSLKSLVPAKGQFFTGDAAKAAAAIKDKIGKPFNVLEVFIDEDEFRMQAQDPSNPKNVDEYKYIGGFVTGPSPVKLNGMNENVDKSSFPFDEIDFAAIPKFTKEAIEKSGIEGAKIYRLTFQRGFALTDTGAGALGSARWLIEINGTRENVTASAGPKGNLLGVDLSRTSKAADYSVLTKDELQKAQDAIRGQQTSRPDIIEIVMYDKDLSYRVPNPENPKVSDSYKYGINGLTRGNDIVKLPSMRGIGGGNYKIEEVDLPRAVDLIEQARTRLDMQKATVSLITIRREQSPFDNKGSRIIWDVNLKAGVKEGSVEYDNEGKETLVRKNGETIFREK